MYSTAIRKSDGFDPSGLLPCHRGARLHQLSAREGVLAPLALADWANVNAFRFKSYGHIHES